MDIKPLLALAIERDASDLHILTNYYPALRIDGQLTQISTLPIVTKDLASEIIFSFLKNEHKENLFANKEIDIGYEYENHRFRVNVYFARGALNASFRLIPRQIKSIEELELPTSFHKLTSFDSGLILVVGPTGEGKTTTIASIINEINTTMAKHIITIEDPIEYVFPQERSIISQRELHDDTHSWNIGLRSVLREDPDVILIGEMRDYESMQHAVTIAETGHLVFSTLHTSSAPETINRIIDIFPSNQQNQIKTQLASVLRAVVAQRLLPRIDKKGRIPAVEVLWNSSAVSAIIREGKPFLLDNVIQTSDEEGFIFFERYLFKLYQEGKISKEDAIGRAIRPKEIEKFFK